MHDGWETRRRRGPGPRLGDRASWARAAPCTGWRWTPRISRATLRELLESTVPPTAGSLPPTWRKRVALRAARRCSRTPGTASTRCCRGADRSPTSRLNYLPGRRRRPAAALRDSGRSEPEDLARLQRAWLRDEADGGAPRLLRLPRLGAPDGRGPPVPGLADLQEAIRSDLAEPRRARTGWRPSPRIRGSARRGAGGVVRGGAGRSARGADAQTLVELIEANRDYETRFGHIFIVCATGKSAGGDARPAARRGWTTIPRPSCASPPRSSGRSPACGWRNFSS